MQIKKCFFLFLTLILLPITDAIAQTNIEFTPSISAIEEYDDNINLSASNERSDYLTMVMPALELDVISRYSNLSLGYSPTFVWYEKNSGDDATRHTGNLDFEQQFSENLTLNLVDTFITSEDPLETADGVVEARNSRNTYYRNAGSVSLFYLFGPQNEITAGYRHAYLKNDEDTVDDGRTQNPFAILNFHVDVRNSLVLEYGYREVKSWNHDPVEIAREDFFGHETGINYIYSFTPHTSLSLRYAFTTRNSEGNSGDYKVHDGSLGFDHSFSADLDVSVSSGYFVQKNEMSGDTDGYTYTAALNKAFERGNISVGGSGGWDESYLEANDRGFSRYWSADSRVEYQIMESLSGSISGRYRYDKDESNRKSDTIRGTLGLSWEFYRWFNLGLNYTFAERDDDNNTSDYTTNRVTVTLTAARLFRW